MTESKLKRAPETVPLAVRVPATIYDKISTDAARRCEDVSTAVRRLLIRALTQDAVNERLEVIERRLGMVLEAVAVERTDETKSLLQEMTQASLEMEGRLNEVVIGQKTAHKDIRALEDAYREIVETLNKYLQRGR